MKKRNLALFVITLIALISVLYSFVIPKNKVVAGSDLDISIDYIPAKEVVCIGEIKFEKGVNYMINVSAESGDKIFVALSDSADIVNAQGVEWKQYFEITGKELEHIFTDIETGNFYVYVGSKGGILEGVVGKVSIIR